MTAGYGLDALVALAVRAEEAAATVRASARVLRDTGDLPWRGPAADAFAARLQRDGDAAVHAAYLLVAVGDAARALHTRAVARAALLTDQALAFGDWYATVPVPTYGALAPTGARS